MTAWPRADRDLERAYRRLLLAYPGRYRARHGTEIITTLLEMAAPGQRRPARGDAWHLLASGVRQRFRLPAGRPLVLLAALLMTLTAGAFGAAAGSWTGEQTFAELPADATVHALAARAAGSDAPTALQPAPVPTVGLTPLLRDPTAWTSQTVSVVAEAGPGWDAEQARARFAADGWSVGALTPLGGAVTELPMRNKQFVVHKDGVAFTVANIIADNGLVEMRGSATRTGAFLPLVLLGLVVGALAGWLGTAELGYRIRHARRRRPAAALSAAALLTLALPAVALSANLMRALRHAGDEFSPVITVHSALSPGPYYAVGPAWQIPVLAIAGVVLAAAAAVIARPAASAQPQESPAAG